MTRGSLLLALLLAAGCQTEPAGTADGEGPDLSPTALPITHDVRPLARTEVQGAATGVSSATTAAVRSSNPQVQRALSTYNARRTAAGVVLTLPEDVLFDFDAHALRADAEQALGQIRVVLDEYAPAPVRIVGHTDNKGEDAYNQTLSERRAEAVRAWLAEHGVPAERLAAQGRGESAPVAPNEHADGSDNPEGRQQNRRVEVVIQAPEGAAPGDAPAGGQPTSTITTAPADTTGAP